MGIRDGEQEELFITHQQLRSQRHPHCQVVNKVLAEKGFDRFAESISAKFYAKKMGRPSMVPGVYSRCLLLGSIPLVRQRSAAHAAPATAKYCGGFLLGPWAQCTDGTRQLGGESGSNCRNAEL